MSITNPYYFSSHWRALRAACLRRDHYRCTVPGCRARGLVADHIITRPRVTYPTPEDRLDNLRTLCLSHDSQVKETRAGVDDRRQEGRFKVRGCDENGWPFDPHHQR